MSVSTALFCSLTGLRVNEARLDVIGNNVANANTTAFKAGRVTFQTAFARTLSIGSAGTGDVAATNPSQIGMGAAIGATTPDFSNGGLAQTGRNTDMAVEGNGFFVVTDVDGATYYTRDGAFTMNANLDLTTADGYLVQGFGVDRNYNVVPGILTTVNIPIGQMTIAQATTEAMLAGNLNAAGEIATQGSVLLTQVLVDTTGPLSDTSLLADLESAADPGTALFVAGDTLTLTPTKGGRTLPSSTLAVTGATSVADLAAWIEGTVGIHTDPGLPGTPGVTVNGSDQLEITGNVGTENQIGVSDLFLVSDNPTNSQPLNLSSLQDADGESARTSFAVYDSLGNEIIVDITTVLESLGSNGDVVWRFFVESADDTDTSVVLGNGTITFDENGVYTASAGTAISLDRDNTGATSPLLFDLDFSNMTSLASVESEIALTTQDGAPLGTLTSFNVDEGGMVMGQFSNGLSVRVAQIALATFSNPEGLLQQGDNLFLVGPNSGLPVVSAPGSLGAGSIVGGALEQSNVDMAREFIELIVASAGFAANSRVISTANRLLNELLSITT